jgi:hypothetical protein
MLLRLEDMTVEQKIGFVLCARRFEEDDIDFTLELIKNKALGCVQAPAEKPELVKKLLDAADYPPQVAGNICRIYSALTGKFLCTSCPLYSFDQLHPQCIIYLHLFLLLAAIYII